MGIAGNLGKFAARAWRLHRAAAADQGERLVPAILPLFSSETTFPAKSGSPEYHLEEQK